MLHSFNNYGKSVARVCWFEQLFPALFDFLRSYLVCDFHESFLSFIFLPCELLAI